MAAGSRNVPAYRHLRRVAWLRRLIGGYDQPSALSYMNELLRLGHLAFN
jgi:hypothetical protein